MNNLLGQASVVWYLKIVLKNVSFRFDGRQDYAQVTHEPSSEGTGHREADPHMTRGTGGLGYM